MAYINKVDEKLQEYSVQQLLDCDDDNYGCTGGWMYQAFAYINKHGVLKRTDYTDWAGKQRQTCDTSEKLLEEKGHLKSIGYIEDDQQNNQQLRELLQQQPLSIGMFTTGMMGAYKSGVMTEDFLHCSYTSNEVNHGVVLVGYGKVGPHDRVRGRCKNYWIIRNSWGPDWGEKGFFKLCADGLGSKKTPLGTCLVNKYTTWPTMDPDDIDPDFDI